MQARCRKYLPCIKLCSTTFAETRIRHVVTSWPILPPPSERVWSDVFRLFSLPSTMPQQGIKHTSDSCHTALPYTCNLLGIFCSQQMSKEQDERRTKRVSMPWRRSRSCRRDHLRGHTIQKSFCLFCTRETEAESWQKSRRWLVTLCCSQSDLGQTKQRTQLDY
jgi:hypothetical protein